MKRIAIALVGSLIGVSAFAADYNMAQPKPVDFNNGELATYPAKVEGYDRPANVRLMPVGPDIAKNSELAAYPWIPAGGNIMPGPIMR